MPSSSKGWDANFNFKIVLLGEGCVGKTSCVLRYVDDQFNERHITTLQASFLNKRLNVRGKRVNLSIWDTAGQERFHALGPIYYRDANGAILVYDITDLDSFRKVKVWIKELRKMLGNKIILVIVGNKTDIEEKRHVEPNMAEEYAKSVGATHFHTSAKLNTGIDELFLELTKQMISVALNNKSDSKNSSGEGGTGNRIHIFDDTSPSSPRNRCCSGSS
ncbi:ras-related protein Rab-21 [Lepeophtheirus salmonis]|uniref:ras-related protein Rab-21 n=1 Tax=Lepeophtheirus salmonis TaxID=72036 RepID=UPI001AE31591|nr:ras-related protein Rab-21-like [Lepeophtheirus salmonis]